MIKYVTKSPSRSHTTICKSYKSDDHIFRLNASLKSPKLEAADVERILYNKFKRIHDIDFCYNDKTVHLKIFYQSPLNPQLYSHKIHYLVNMIELWDCGSVFTNKINAAHYPDYIIDTGSVIDVPIVINLDIPSDN